MKKYLLILLILSLIAVWPFFKKGYFETHDGDWMIIRFSAFHQTLAAGQFPVRFVDRLNNNFGYPVANFLYPLPFYLAEVPKILGFNFTDSIKLITVLSTIGSALVMYWALSQKFTKEASLAGAVVYLFAPYRFVDLYVRGSFGENVAFLFVPLIFGLILKLANKKKLFIPILSFAVAGLVLSHNVLGVLFLPILFSIGLVLAQRSRTNIFIGFSGGLAISVFYWLPALYDLKYVKYSQIQISEVADHLTNFSKLVIPSLGFGPLPQGQASFSPQLGLVTIAVFIAAIIFRAIEKKRNYFVDFLLLLFVVCAFLMIDSSLPFWNIIPSVDVIQFPWRLLSIIVFVSAILTAYVVSKGDRKQIVVSIIVLSAVISTAVYTVPKSFVDRDDSFYSTNEDTTTVRDEYMPIWVLEKPNFRASEKIEIDEGEAGIISQQIQPAKYTGVIESPGLSKVKVNSVYFPGWRVDVDGVKQAIDYQNKYGFITFELPKGMHEVIIRYTRTPVHLASEIISLITFLGAGIYFFTRWRKANQK